MKNKLQNISALKMDAKKSHHANEIKLNAIRNNEIRKKLIFICDSLPQIILIDILQTTLDSFYLKSCHLKWIAFLLSLDDFALFYSHGLTHNSIKIYLPCRLPYENWWKKSIIIGCLLLWLCSGATVGQLKASLSLSYQLIASLHL